MDPAHINRSIRALLAELIDYAGLFPPASLAMADAVSRYARYRRGPHAWMLGRFIVSRVRLEEFERHAQRQFQGEPWPVSVLVRGGLESDATAIAAFNHRHRDGARVDARIDTIEVAAESYEVPRIAGALPALRLWFEIASDPPTGADARLALQTTLNAIRSVGPHAGAKLRTGGVNPGAIPTADIVAWFLLSCARAGVACKATAGLHHPIHAPHRLTYADDSPTALMHGFVNVFLAAALARDLVSRHPHADSAEDAEILHTLVALLDEGDARHIAWRDDHVAWRGHRVELEAIASTRAQFARSFGSCSFEEPIEDLEQLGWL